MRFILYGALLFGLAPACVAADLEVGFGEQDITPDFQNKAVWIAGYGNNRRANAAHDPIMARAIVLKSGNEKIALATLDLVGLQYPETLKIRAQLSGFRYVLVASTHNHEGPDVIGLWGPNQLVSGVDPQYLEMVVNKTVAAIHAAENSLSPAEAVYGTAEDQSGLLRDSRLPQVFDNVCRVLKFVRPGAGEPIGILVNWNCHPESVGSENQSLTADFPAATVAALRERHHCSVAYFTGTVGGLMTTPHNRYANRAAGAIADDTLEYAAEYGREVADLSDRALQSSKPARLTPFVVAAKPIAVPLVNPLYYAARNVGVLVRDGRQWTGNAEQLGEPRPAGKPSAERMIAFETEVAYLRLGEIHIAGIPGEIYPELVYGQYQEPVETGADYPDAPLEPPVMKTLPGEKTLLFGLANDEIGYIIPKRQWDERAPFCYGRKDRQYGEVNSCGPDIAPVLMEALVNRVREASSQPAK